MGPNPWNDCMEASKIWKTERDTQPSENMDEKSAPGSLEFIVKTLN